MGFNAGLEKPAFLMSKPFVVCHWLRERTGLQRKRPTNIASAIIAGVRLASEELFR